MPLPPSSLELPPSHPELCQAIAERILASPDQQITFADFMELALYQPQYGYYATNQAGQGIQSDFFTSPHLGADFGELLAEQLAQMWERLDRPQPFTLVEMGAGQGLLVQDILTYLHRHDPECSQALNYLIIEQSPALVAAQQQRLQGLSWSDVPWSDVPWSDGPWSNVRWCDWSDIPANSIVGCCFSNELVDALPVHQVAIDNGELREVYVTLANDYPLTQENLFQETLGSLSTPQLSEYFQRLNLPLPSDRYPQGYRTEVNLAARDWLSTVADRLQRGYVLTIDYGYTAQRYYSPTRSQGTLQCYYRHAHHSDPYQAIGRQDITAHVDFTSLEQWGHELGLEAIGLTQQAMFLMALGLGERMSGLSQMPENTPLPELLQRREALRALIDPLGLGNFSVLIQGKGLARSGQEQPLKGLAVPPLF